ncbi:hypothetical protein J132_00901 [Termitomyces sp. J132]|nr:hypothetical protein J132_00901 [Termitomyces sp. J132]
MIGDSNITFRESSFSTFFNPTSTAPPFFQIFDSAFLTILGPNPSIREVASNSTFAFAHEAPVYVSDTNEVFFASNDGGPLGMKTGSVRVVATDFDKCNGIAFTADGNIAYISDTGATSGFLGNNQTEPATIYAFDVDPRTHMFKNRRVFAYVDAGVPDGIQVDIQGNVYSGCGDGVWNDEGTLIGKFFLGTTSANMVLTTDGRLVIMAETKIFVAEIAAKGIPPISP